MEEIILNIEHLAKSKCLVPAEPIIMQAVENLSPFLDDKLTEFDFSRIQKALISLYSINGSKFSLQCSMFIASKLSFIYGRSKSPQIWDLFNLAVSNTTPSTVIASGYVCKQVGSKFKSQLPRLVEHLIKYPYHSLTSSHISNIDILKFSALYTLSAAFKSGEQSLSCYAINAFDFARSILLQRKQETTIAAIKLLRRLLNFSSISAQQIIELIKIYHQEDYPSFVQDEIAQLIAKCLYLPYSHINLSDNVGNEWSIGLNRYNQQLINFQNDFSIILGFPSIISSIVSHFLNFLGPSLISLNHSQLFSFISTYTPSEISTLIRMMGINLRFTYFKKYLSASQSKNRLPILLLLCPDDSTIDSVAELSIIDITFPDKIIQLQAKKVLEFLVKNHSELGLKFFGITLSSILKPKATPKDIIGNGRAASIILSSLKDPLPAIAEQRDKLKRLIVHLSKVSSQPQTIQNSLVLATFSILIHLKKSYASLQIVSQAIEHMIKYFKTIPITMKENKSSTINSSDLKLIEKVLEFRTKFIDKKQSRSLVETLLSIPIHFSRKILKCLCKLIPILLFQDPIAYSTANLLLQYAFPIIPSTSLVKSYLPHPLPVGTDLLYSNSQQTFSGMSDHVNNKHKTDLDLLGLSDTIQKQKKDDNLISEIIKAFPAILCACSVPEQNKLIALLLDKSTINTTKLLLTHAIVENQFTKDFLTQSFYSHFFTLLTTENTALIQVVCDCIALFIRNKSSLLPSVLDFIEKRNDYVSCILLSALFSRVDFPTPLLSRATIFLTSLIKGGRTVLIVVHAMTSLFLTHSMQLTDLDVVEGELSLLFQCFNRTATLQPIFMHVLSECYDILLETFSTELLSPESSKSRTALLILRAVQFTPTSYAKQVYYECCRTLYTFAHHLSEYAPITYPYHSNKTPLLQIKACSALIDFLKFENPKEQKNNFDLPSLTASLLALLQKTGDERASNFLLSLASMMNNNPISFVYSNNQTDPNSQIKKETDLEFWVKTISRILLTSALFDNSTVPVEPTPEVKKCALKICLLAIPKLASQENLQLNLLDDIITSSVRAIETGHSQLIETAFPVLSEVILKFRDRTIEEGGRLLELHNSQFISAVKIGFQVELRISGDFLCSYLSFNTSEMDRDPESCSAILVVYLSALKACQQRTAPFFQLASHLCTVGRQYKQVQKLFASFLNTLAPIFSNVVTEAMKLWAKSDDWRELSKFRIFASQFYGQLLPGFVWLQTLSQSKENQIPIDVLVSFCVVELESKSSMKEKWMKSAALDALSVAIEFCGEQISPNLLELAIQSAINNSYLSEKSDDLLKSILDHSATLLKTNKEYINLRKILLTYAISSYFSASTFAYLLHSSSLKDSHDESIVKYSPTIGYLFIEKAEKNLLTSNEVLALFYLLFKAVPTIIGSILDYVLTKSKLSTELKFDLIGIALGIDNSENLKLPLSNILKFSISSFRKGGLQLLGRLIIQKPKLGFYFIAKGGAKAAFVMSIKNSENSSAYLRFISLSLNNVNKISNNQVIIEKFAKSVLRIAIANVISLNRPGDGSKSFLQAILLIRETIAILGPKFENVYSALSSQEKLQLIKTLEERKEHQALMQKASNLISFSSNQRKKSGFNEWCELEIEEED